MLTIEISLVTLIITVSNMTMMMAIIIVVIDIITSIIFLFNVWLCGCVAFMYPVCLTNRYI